MSLLLAILRTLAPEGTGNKFGGGMFVKNMYDRRKRTNPGPRYVDRYDLVSGEPVPFTNGTSADAPALARAVPSQPEPTPAKARAASRTARPMADVITFIRSGETLARAEKMVLEEQAIRERQYLNNAVAILLLLAS